MNSLIIKKPIFQLGPQIPSQNLIFQSLRNQNPRFVLFPLGKYSFNAQVILSCSCTGSDSLGYGGWDCQIGDKSIHSGESNLFHNFLISLGIDDKKYWVVYFLGFISALAIFRVKVSSVVAFPACALVFAVGFSIGFVNRGQIRWSEAKKMKKELPINEFVEKLRNLVDLFNGCNIKTLSLRNNVMKAIDYKQITEDDLVNILNAVELINLSTMDARNAVERCIESIVTENQEPGSQKSVRRKKEVGEHGFNFAQVVSGLFQEKSNLPKRNDTSNKASINMEVNDKKHRNILASPVEDRSVNLLLNRYSGNTDESLGGRMSDSHSKTRYKDQIFTFSSGRISTLEDTASLHMDNSTSSAAEGLFSSTYHGYQKRRSYHTSNQEFSWKKDHVNEVEAQPSDSYDHLLDSMDLGASPRHPKTRLPYSQEWETDDTKVEEHFESMEERQSHHAFESFSRQQRVSLDSEFPLGDVESAAVLEDMEFDRCLSEASKLLKEAKECLMRRRDNGVAENALNSSARLLVRAVNMRPMSLLAVGQLGNAYLFHGELKLRRSRELRSVLERTDTVLGDKWDVEEQTSRRDKIIPVLVKVCEECEELLLEAGRKYKMALAIDASDMKALYNWGLALFFRAQLIADTGPGGVREADKTFLAAIDKFDAMISRSNLYAPDALFRWGAALQQRSRLRPRRSKDKMKLLQQATRLYQDALDMDSDNIQVKDALSSCMSELKHWYDR